MSLKICTFALLAISACTSLSNAQDVVTEDERPETIEELTSKVYNFKKACDKGIKLIFNDRKINVNGLTFSKEEAKTLKDEFLIDNIDCLASRVDVWCKMAKLQKELIMEQNGKIPKKYNIQDLNLIDDVAVSHAEIDDVVEGQRNPANGMRTISQSQKKIKAPKSDRKGSKSNKGKKAKRRPKRKILNYASNYWTNGIIPWQFEDITAWTTGQENIIRQAVATWEANTCLDFQETTATSGPRVTVVRRSGCWSYVGKQSNGQSLSLGQNCVYLGIACHEFGHAIGFSHEQSRPDRDNYVTINFDNIDQSKWSNFYAKSFSAYKTYGVPYDYTSVMHYSSKSFALDRSDDSIITNDPEMKKSIGQRQGLSFYDIKVVNKKYCESACPGHATLEWDMCENNGYRNPNKCDECHCPAGFDKPYCAEPIKNIGCNSVQQPNNIFTAIENTVQTFSPPGWDAVSEHPLNTLCVYKFKAPEGMAVKLKVTNLNLRYASYTCSSFLEVRHENMALSGPRFCGSSAPREEFVSHGDDLLLCMQTTTSGYKGFKVEYSAVRCGGCSAGATIPPTEPACLYTGLFECGDSTTGENTCYDNDIADKRYCCDGYELSGEVCNVISCPSLPTPVNGVLQGTDLTYGSATNLVCNDGFESAGPTSRVCQDDKTWSNQEFACQAVSCPALTAPSNGVLQGTDWTFNSAVNLVCNDGFESAGSTSRVCQADTTWSNQEFACGAVSCPALTVPSNGVLQGTDWTFNSAVNLVCNDGFESAGPTSRVCQADTTWSNQEFACGAVSCPALTAPSNGVLQGTDWTFNSAVNLVCNDGFESAGSTSRVCQADTTWSNQEFACGAVSCPALTAPSNGVLQGTDWTFNSAVNLVCNDGFESAGSTSRVCQADTTWSNQEFACGAVSCPALTAPSNGVLQGTDWTFNSAVNLVCNDGFESAGPTSRVCQADTTWSNQEFACGVISCPPLTAPTNGVLTGSDLTYGSTITLDCNEGFDLVGSDSRICQGDRTWSNLQPTCEVISCPPLTAPTNGALTGSDITYGSTITLDCNEGFDLVGSDSRICQGDRTWSNLQPTCEVISCPPLTAPTNGVLTGSDLTYGSTITLDCNEGFDLVGSDSRICQGDRTWSNLQPTCEVISCPPLTAPTNGALTGSDLTYGSTITLDCNEGFDLVGSDSRICQGDRTWSNLQPTCEVISCPPLTAPTNGVLTGSDLTYGSTITLDCNEGFDLVGSDSRICQGDRTWSNLQPTCEVISCPPLTAPTNGALTGSDLTYGSTITLDCNEGFDLVGSDSRICQGDRTWSNLQPTCEVISCPPLTAPTNGVLTGSDLTYGSTITLDCNEGFDLVGSDSRICQGDRTWSNLQPTCEVISCPPLTAPSNGVLTGSDLTYGSTITLDCNEGFDLVGSDSRICQGDRTWSNLQPTCEVISCPPSTAPTNGVLTGSDLTYGSTITLDCNEGFDLVGSDSRICQGDRTWSNLQPTCEVISCPPLTAPSNGALTGSDLTYGSTITLDCNEGFDLVGSDSRICQGDRTWSNLQPTCEVISCPPLTAPTNGALTGSDLTYGSTITLDCNEGFDLVGSDSRICQGDRTWSNLQPTCEEITTTSTTTTTTTPPTTTPYYTTEGGDSGFWWYG